MSAKFNDEQIVNAGVHNLNWTHFRRLLRVADENARLWYMKKAENEGWSSRVLNAEIKEIMAREEQLRAEIDRIIAEMEK